MKEVNGHHLEIKCTKLGLSDVIHDVPTSRFEKRVAQPKSLGEQMSMVAMLENPWNTNQPEEEFLILSVHGLSVEQKLDKEDTYDIDSVVEYLLRELYYKVKNSRIVNES